ncbi:lysophospholipid acyltransferase family protein [Verrucomicrobiaceae bacterium 227]
MSSKTEIRTNWKARASGRLLGWFIRLLGMTLRREIRGDLARVNASDLPVIHVLWHNQICVAPYLWRKMFPKRECVVLTSASKDGVVLASAVKVFRVGAVHGSSSRRGVAALVALRKAAKEGKDLVFTPDGPRGPKYELQPGVVKIAQTSGCLVSPFKIEFSSCWRLKSWDAFQIPKPFSKAVVTMLEPMEIPPKLDEEGFEKQRLLLESALRQGLTD